MEQLIVQLLTVFGPAVLNWINGFRDRENRMPTEAEMLAEFKANGAAILADIDAWRASHPND